MPKECSVCQSENLALIDSAILNRESYRNVAKQFRVGYSAVYRHAKEHLPTSIKEGAETAGIDPTDIIEPSKGPSHLALTAPKFPGEVPSVASETSATRLVRRMANLDQRTLSILEKAESEGRLETALKAIREARGNTELVARLEGALNEQGPITVQIGIVMPRPREGSERTRIIDISETR